MSNIRNFTQTTLIDGVVAKVEHSDHEIGETITTSCLCSECWKKTTLVSEFVAVDDKNGVFVRKNKSCKCKEN